MEQQYPDGFPSHLRHQFALHRLFGHQPDRPPRLPWGGALQTIAMTRCRSLLVQQRNGPRSLLVPERPIQACLLIAPSHLTDRLGGQPDVGGHLGNRSPRAVAPGPEREEQPAPAEFHHAGDGPPYPGGAWAGERKVADRLA